MRTDLLPCSDLEAYRTWRARRVGPAYFRGQPAWVWRTAIKRSCQER